MIKRYYHTIKHFSLKQIFYLLKSKITSKDPTPYIKQVAKSYPIQFNQPKLKNLPLLPLYHGNSDDLKNGVFTFLNKSTHQGFPPQWQNDESLLWQYNLHYFDYIFILDFASAKSLMLNWIERNSNNYSPAAWSPYSTSLRLRNIATYFYLLHLKETLQDSKFKKILDKTIFHQFIYLSNHIEHQYRGNHLLENYFTIIFISTLFIHPVIQKIATTVHNSFLVELNEQVLSDGGYFERSPMYHSIILTTLLNLLNILDEDSHYFEIIYSNAKKMLQFLNDFCHPDGEIVLFNDATFGIAPTPADIINYAKQFNIHSKSKNGLTAYLQTGVLSYQAKTLFLAIDAAPIGPTYVPAHAHNDIFSFELSVDGHRVFTDAGTSTYEPGAIRQFERSTRAHNTLSINSEEQCDTWSSFRVGRRGTPFSVELKETSQGFHLRGCHNGYKHLPGSPIHQRIFNLKNSNHLEIIDFVQSKKTHDITVYFHFSPDVILEIAKDNLVKIHHPPIPKILTLSFNEKLHLDIFETAYAPKFSTRIKRQSLSCKLIDTVTLHSLFSIS